MSEPDRFAAFKRAVDAGSPIPQVDSEDLQRIHAVFTDVAKNSPKQAVGLDYLATICSPGADVEVVCLRSWLLDVLIRHGVLSEWLKNPSRRETVYKVAATISISGIQLDPAAFLRKLAEAHADS